MGRRSTLISSTSAQASGSPALKQPEMKDRLKLEIGDNVFQFPNFAILSDVFYLGRHENQIVGINAENIHPDIRAVMNKLLAHRGSEAVSYGHLAELLKAILKWAVTAKITSARSLIMKDVSSKPMERTQDSANGIKPDGLIVEDAGDSKPSWRRSFCFVEVKESWSEILVQANTYARATFSFPNRWYALGIGYNQTKHDVRFLFYTRMGVFVTPRVSLRNGIQHVCRVFVALSVLGEERLGFELHRKSTSESSTIFLPHVTGNSPSFVGGNWYEELGDDVLCSRVSIKGRATRVSSLQLVTNNASANTPAVATPIPANSLQVKLLNLETEGNLDANADSWWGAISADEANPLEGEAWCIDWSRSPHETLPPGLIKSVNICKDSWPLLARARNEAAMLRSIQGQHGAPEISLALFSIHHMYKFWRLAPFLRCEDWTYSEDSTVANPSPEFRVHSRLITHTNGRNLSHLKDKPTELVRAVMDVAICLRILFSKGWLHRDVSVGNVLFAEADQTYNPADLPAELTKINVLKPYLRGHFKGFLIDGDLAITVTSGEKVSKERSGTPPFISTRILEDIKQSIQHTALDDLESLTWVLFWVALVPKSEKQKPTDKLKAKILSDKEESWVTQLSSPKFDNIHAIKDSIVTQFTRKYAKSSLRSNSLCALSGLFSKLFNLHLRAHDSLEDILPSNEPEGIEDADKLLKDTTEQYFEEFFTVLDNFLNGKLPPVFHPLGSK